MSEPEWTEEYPMNMDDEDAAAPTELSLNALAAMAQDLAALTGLSSSQLRHHLIERTLLPLAAKKGMTDEIILSHNNEDDKYKALVCELYPTLSKLVDNVDHSKNRPYLQELLTVAMSLVVWDEIENKVKAKSIDTKQFQGVTQQACDTTVYFENEVFPITDFVRSVAVERRSVEKGDFEVISDLLGVLKALNTVGTGNSSVVSKRAARPTQDKQTYIRELASKGFFPKDNKTSVAGKTGIHDTLIGLIKLFYSESPVSSLGFKDKVYMVNQSLLESKGVNPKGVDIWNAATYTLDEDLMFRVFIKEDDISFTVLIKLPVGVTNFDFSRKSSELDAIPLLFSNMNPSAGTVYSSSLMKQPRVCNLGSTRKVKAAYDCIEMVLSKDLLAFRNANWSLRDYIRACQGEQNDFASFDDLSLGEKIVVGVMPGALKAERFDCSGKYNVSGIVGGGAGSGKTAMYDSLLVQSIALQGVEGNGAVVLIDQKEEWVPIWRKVFNSLGVPFYGFDGEVLNSAELKWVDIKRGERIVENIPFKVNAYIGGILFARVVYQTIQVILKETGCSDIIEFNKGNHNYKGITRLPRIFFLVDELNSLYASIKGDPAIPQSVYKGLILARLTRTSGFHWLLGGQDPSKTLIASDERSNYNYNIFGKMADERYEYFGVTQNQAVQGYEKKHGTLDNPNPILSQGVFYAGPKGKTDLVKSLFVSKDERLDAIRDLNSSLSGMQELDKIVRLALAEGYFDAFEVTLGKPNNIVYATLRNLGVISQKEFEYYTERVLSGNNNDASDVLDDALNVYEADSVKKSPTSTNVVEQNRPLEKTSSGTILSERREVPDDYMQLKNARPVYQNHVIQDPYVSPREQNAFSAIYEAQVDPEVNPFEVFKVENGDNLNPFSSMTAFRMMSDMLMKQIKQMVGDLKRIESFEVTGNGLIINDVAFRPRFSQEVLKSMPYAIRVQVEKGNVVELFHFKNIFRFKNLVCLRIDNARLAEGRVRREIGWSQRKSWFKLFDHFRHLSELYIGGELIADEETAKEYDNRGRGGFTLTEKLRNAFGLGVNVVSSSHMERVWDSKPVRVMGSAVGWTLAFKGMTLAASLLGPWGIVFAGLAGYKAYQELRNRQGHKQTQMPKHLKGQMPTQQQRQSQWQWQQQQQTQDPRYRQGTKRTRR